MPQSHLAGPLAGRLVLSTTKRNGPQADRLNKMLRVILPHHLRELARVSREVQIPAPPIVTIASVLDSLESQYPVLRGTIRDEFTRKRRPLVRFFACEEDWSDTATDT